MPYAILISHGTCKKLLYYLLGFYKKANTNIQNSPYKLYANILTTQFMDSAYLFLYIKLFTVT